MGPDNDIQRLVWDDWNLDHATKHKVSIEEIEETVSRPTIRKPTHKGRLLLVGTTESGRFVSVVVGPNPYEAGAYYVFSARPASPPERRRYVQLMGGGDP